MTMLYESLEILARDKANQDIDFAKYTIQSINEYYNQGKIDLVEKSQLLDILN